MCESNYRLSPGQQIYAIIWNTRGSVGQRLGHISGMLHADMTKYAFVAVVDPILDVADPLEKEAEFPEAAKFWGDLAAKAHEG